MEKYYENIRKEMDKIIDTLKSEYNITLKELKEIQYAIQYEVKDESSSAIINVYKSFKITCNGNSDKRLVDIVKKQFDMRNCIKNQEKKEEKKIEQDFSEIDEYYHILKNYENDNIDFSIFADKLLKYCDEKDKEICEQNKNNFNILEKIYKKIKN
ncbi:MAG: hypothetical protein SOY42_09080 [Clostridium sp.]|nr:hypothetical protein [Clostridium sp.]MDY4078919.1 hypothetical protein [Clostridium sp.]